MSDEPDFQPLPDALALESGIAAAFEAISSIFIQTRLEDDLEEVLWSLVNLFQHRLDHTGKKLDENGSNQRD